MKKLSILIMAFIFISVATVWAMQATTKKGYTACYKKADLEDIIIFSSAKDLLSMNAYIEQGKCIILGDGHTVTITTSPGMLGNRVEFVFMGEKFWTVRDALKDYR